MDNSNWRPTQAESNNMDSTDWRTQLQPDSRQRIVNKIMETLKRHLPITGPEGLVELSKIATRFEEKIYTAGTSQSDYLRKISMKMLTMETKSQTTSMANTIQPNSAGSAQNPPDPASHSMQSQVRNQGQSQMALPNQSQVRQQLLSQNVQNTIANTGVQTSATLSSALPSISTNLQSGITQNSVGNSVSQGVPSNIFSNTQRQMQGRPLSQQITPQQQQLQSQNPQYMYQQQQQQQLQHQLIKQKLQGNMQSSLLQPHMQQQPQQQSQNLLQPAQMQSSQQSHMQMSSGGLQSSQPTLQQSQSSVMQSAPHSGLQQNQQSTAAHSTASVLQQHSQSVLRPQQQSQQSLHQQTTAHQQQTSMSQPPILSSQQQQQQLLGQQPNTANIQQNQLLGQQNSIPDMQQQQQQQQQRLLSQQNNMSNMQHQQSLGQQNNISNLHQQQLGQQNSAPALQQQQQQQQQMLGTQSGVSNMQPHQQPMQIMHQQSKGQQQLQQTPSSLLQTQGQHAQSQPNQQQLMSQNQPQPTQIQQQLGLQQQANPLQRDMQQRLQPSGNSMLHPQSLMDQKQVFHSQRPPPEASATSMDSTAGQSAVDWQEEIYQKIKSMKELYLPDLNDMYQKISIKCQQHDSVLNVQKSEQIDRLKMFKNMLERTIQFLNVAKNNIVPAVKDKLSAYEKQIISILNSNRPRKPLPAQQQIQQPGSHPLSMQQHHQQQQQQQQQHQQQQQQQQPDNQLNPQMQPMNMQSSVSSMQTTASNMHHGALPPLANHLGVSATQTSLMNSLQPGSTLESGQGNASNSLQQVGGASLQQSSVNATQQANINTLSQSGVSGLQANINPIQLSSNMIQHQHLKQHQEQQQQLMQTQQMKQQFQQRQMHQHLLNKQQLLQQQHPQLQQQFQQLAHQQQKPQQSAQLQAGHQMPQLHQISEDLKIRQGMGFKQGMTQQHLSAGHRSTYNHQQLKAGASFPISSPQLLQVTSPQISQHSSPQIDQQSLLTSLSKNGTPLQSANSPFIVASPSTPAMAPSPIPGDPEKQISGVSSLSNAGVGQPHSTNSLAQVQSLAIATPGLSASPLLAEFTGADGNQGTASTIISGKSSVIEQPLERLIKVVKSVSPNAFSASVSDIGSVISMIDRIAGSAPGNGSRAAVGEDLVAMTKCRMQARNFSTQDGNSATKKMRRNTSAMPLNTMTPAGSVNDSFKQINGLETSDLESTATSRIQRSRFEANHVLLEEIREINQRLIDTVVDISDEDVDPAAGAAEGEGTIVKCSFNAVALSPNLKSQYASAQMSPILPLRLLIPTNYPNCSPILLDKFPVELSTESEDLSMKAKSRFSISLRSLSQPMSLADMVKTWDISARAVLADYAQKSGGGCFSSRYGTWENCVGAA